MLPTFLIAGERRCGTSSLYEWLSPHPDVFLNPRRDTAFFLEDEIVGTTTWRDGETDPEAWEASHTPEAYGERFREGAGCAAVGEKCADLLFWRPAHLRVARYMPDARFLVILRNPVDRAWSHYWNEVGKGREHLGFREALDAEAERASRSAWARNHLSYRERGHYARSLVAFHESVPADNVLVLILEESRRRAEGALRAVFDFLGVDPAQGGERAGSQHNRNVVLALRPWANRPAIRPLASLYDRIAEAVVVRAYAGGKRREAARRRLKAVFRAPATSVPMPAGIRSELEAHYRPHVRELEDLLGRRLDVWS